MNFNNRLFLNVERNFLQRRVFAMLVGVRILHYISNLVPNWLVCEFANYCWKKINLNHQFNLSGRSISNTSRRLSLATTTTLQQSTLPLRSSNYDEQFIAKSEKLFRSGGSEGGREVGSSL